MTSPFHNIPIYEDKKTQLKACICTEPRILLTLEITDCCWNAYPSNIRCLFPFKKITLLYKIVCHNLRELTPYIYIPKAQWTRSTTRAASGLVVLRSISAVCCKPSVWPELDLEHNSWWRQGGRSGHYRMSILSQQIHHYAYGGIKQKRIIWFPITSIYCIPKPLCLFFFFWAMARTQCAATESHH